MTPSPEGPAATAAQSRDPSRAQPAPVAAGVARPPAGIRKAWIALRSAVYLLLLALTVAPYSIFSLLCIVTPHPLRYWLITGWPKTALWLARVVCGIRYEVTGWENLPDGPAVLLPKHQSAWETIWLIASMPRPSSFVYKRELHRIPFFGWGIATLGMISIDRGRGTDAFEQVVEQGQKRLAEGWYVIIFPEGTRTAPGTHTRYKTGGRPGARRRARGADRPQLGRTMAAQGLSQDSRYDHGVDRSAGRHPGTQRRRSGAHDGALDRNGDAQDRTAPLSAGVRRRQWLASRGNSAST